jgi:hypothetical protein
MQASLGNVIKGHGDNEDVHFEDTVRGSDWGADQRVVRMFVNTAPKAVRELAAWGVPWSRVRRGDREVVINAEKVTITERDEAHGLLAQRDFGGTKKWRTCYVSDGTGHAMLYAMSDQAIASEIPVHERTEAIALVHDAGRCHGAIVRNLITGESPPMSQRSDVCRQRRPALRSTTGDINSIGGAIAWNRHQRSNMEAVNSVKRPSSLRHPHGRSCRGTWPAQGRSRPSSCRTTSRRRRRRARCRGAPDGEHIRQQGMRSVQRLLWLDIRCSTKRIDKE